MPELSRADKLAAAQKKLRQFQQTKANRQLDEEHTVSPVSVGQSLNNVGYSNTSYENEIVRIPVVYSTQNNASNQQGHINQSSSTNSYYNKPTSLADYFTNSINKNEDIDLIGTDNFIPSSTASVIQPNICNDNYNSHYSQTNSNQSYSSVYQVPTYNTESSQYDVTNEPYTQIMNKNATDTNASSLTTTVTPKTLNADQHSPRLPVSYINEPFSHNHTLNTTTLTTTTNSTTITGAIYMNNDLNKSVHDTNNLQQTIDVDSNSFEEDNQQELITAMPTATTEKLLQLSRQLDGILQTSEQITSSIHNSNTPSIHNEYSPNNSLINNDIILESTNSSPNEQINNYLDGNYSLQLGQQLSHPNRTLSKQSIQMNSNHNTQIIRELEERNVELASLLEKRNRAYDRVMVKMRSMKEQSDRMLQDAATERANLEANSQRDLNKTKEQIRAHAQTIGVLVAEKTELQTQVAHLDRLSEQRSKEIDEINQRLQLSHQQILELQKETNQTKLMMDELKCKNSDLINQVDRYNKEVKREKLLRQNLETELDEVHSRLNMKLSEMAQLDASLNELRRQLELSQVYASQFTSNPDSNEPKLNECDDDWLTERIQLENRIKELESSTASINNDRERLESQYRNYVVQLEQQTEELRSRLFESNKSKQDLELTLDTTQKELRQKESEISDLICRLELVKSNSNPTVSNLNDGSSMIIIDNQSTQSSNECTQVNTLTDSEYAVKRLNELEQNVKDRTNELENAKSEILDLTNQLTTAQETIAQTQSLLVDRELVLNQAITEKNTLSRAVEQNRTLKQQLVELQDEFVKMSTVNMNLTTDLQCEQHRTKELNNSLQIYQTQLDELKKQYEHCQNQLNILNNSNPTSTNHLSIQRDDQCSQTITQMEFTNLEEKQSTEILTNQFENIEKLKTELESFQITSNQLSDENIKLNNLFHRIRLICEHLNEQNHENKSQFNDQSQLNDPSNCVNILENIVHKLQSYYDHHNTTHRNEVLIQTENNILEQDSNLIKLPSIKEWENFQLVYEQLENKFLDCMNKLSKADEQRTQLESIIAKLEMEALTVEEYVTLFAHRRAKASRRAQAREQLLKRLVDDRKYLRSRLQKLINLTQNLKETKEDNEITNQNLNSSQLDSTLITNQNVSTEFLREFKRLVGEIEPSIEENQYEAGSSVLNDEDNNDDDDTNIMINDQLNDSHHLVKNDNSYLSYTNNTIANSTTTNNTLEDLRLQALQHDCPHCKCCVGSLLEV